MGFSHGAKQGAIQGCIDSIVDYFTEDRQYTNKDQNALTKILEKSFYSALRSGVISGFTNMATSQRGKSFAGFSGSVLFDSAGSLIDFFNGKIGLDELTTNVLGNVVSNGISIAKAKVAQSVISGITSMSASATAGGTAKLAGFTAKKLTGSLFCGCLFAGAILALGAMFCQPKDPRVAIYVEVNEDGKCQIRSTLPNNFVQKLIDHNNRVDYINNKMADVNKNRQSLRKDEIFVKQELLKK
jgi:hypothetical protein